MDALRRLSWPHLIPINPRQASQTSPPTPSSLIPKHRSVQDLVCRIESKQERAHRTSLEEAWLQSPSCRFLIPYSGSNRPRSTSLVLEAKQADVKVQYEEKRMLGTYLQLPASPKGFEAEVGQEILERFPTFGLHRAMDSAADDNEGLPPIPDTPTGYARFGFISRESFNTAVQDLVQQSPDKPIGGDGAAPMKRSFNVGTLAINSSTTFLDAPQIESSSPPNIIEYDGEKKKALRSRSNFSDPFQESYESKARPLTGGSSPTMITAPQSPRVDRSNNQTSLSLDGPGRGGTDVRDFAQSPDPLQEPDCPPLPDCCVSPRTPVSDICTYDSPNIGASAAKENRRRVPMSGLSPVPIPMEEYGTAKTNASEAIRISAMPNEAVSSIPSSAPGVAVVIEETRSKGLNAPALPQIPVVTDGVEAQGLNAPKLTLPQGPAVGILADVTGQLQPPGTPPRREKKGKKAIRKGQNLFRKGRRIILNKPVLTVVVGRQLSGPTAEALKLISKGVPLDASDLARGVPTPVPVPGIPA